MLDKIKQIETASGQKYPLVFNLNVMEILQNEYGNLENWTKEISNKEAEPNIKALKFGLGAMINEGIDIENDTVDIKRNMLTDKQIGRIITEVGITDMAEQLKLSVVDSVDTGEKTKNV